MGLRCGSSVRCRQPRLEEESALGTNKRVRFFVHVGEQHSQLIAISESPKGDLIITQRPNGTLEVPDFEGATIKTQRYTVHVSPNSTGHILNSRCELQSGDYLRNVSFVSCEHNPLLAILFTRRWPIMRREGFRVPDAQHIDARQVAAYDEDRNNLLTHVVISQVGLGPQICRMYGGCMHSFREFDVAVIPRYIWFPSSSKGDTITPSSSDLEISGDFGRGRLGQIQALGIEELARVMLELEQPLLLRLRERIAAQINLNLMDPKNREVAINRIGKLQIYRLPL